MNLFPRSSGSRPRTACEITPDSVVAARSLENAESLSSASRVTLPEGAVSPSLKPGNLPDRVAVIAAIRRALEGVGVRPNSRGADLTLIIPDGAARVLLLDFDTLPTKLTEALPIVRFRLKKLLPFEADDAMVSYQVMSSSRTVLRVLAVAMPRDVLTEYETAAREAGYEPGAVLPSTLAALPGMPSGEPALLINGSPVGLTTAILDKETLLLHRTVDLQSGPAAIPANMPPALFQGSENYGVEGRNGIPTVGADRIETSHGFNPYADRRATEEAVQGYDSVTGLPVAPAFGQADPGQYSGEERSTFSDDNGSPIQVSPFSLRSLAGSEAELTHLAATALSAERAVANPGQDLEEEVARAVSVAMAYFEDTLASQPRQLWSAGSMTAESIARLLSRRGLLQASGLEVREVVSVSLLQGASLSATVPRHSLAGVVGALRG